MSRRRRGLRPEEEALWKRIAEQATPLWPQHAQAPPAENPAAQSGRITGEEPALVPRFMIGEKAGGKGAEKMTWSQPSANPDPAPAPLRMSRKAHGQMMRGKMRPEGRLDLHGMTLEEAHPALTSFIMSSHARQRRLVLVITGKGRIRDEGGPIPARRGILRHHVPQWLAAPPLAGMVLEVRPAHSRHGGEGAFYVYLRRRRAR